MRRLALALLLFVSGSLVFPSDTQLSGALRDDVESRGRWALACLAAVFLVGFLLNPLFFGGGVWNPSTSST